MTADRGSEQLAEILEQTLARAPEDRQRSLDEAPENPDDSANFDHQDWGVPVLYLRSSEGVKRT